MSIINEALKKTGQFIQENEAKNNPAVKITAAPRPLLIYILILLTGILLSKFIFGLLSHKAQNSSLASSSQSQKVKTAESVAPPVSPAAPVSLSENNKATKPDFVLNGIFFSDNDGYALVNNQIVRENESVDGAKVAKITSTTVELDNHGELISLSTHR